MNNMYNNVIYPADTSGCGWYRMIFPKVALQTMTKNISFIESMKCICDARFFNHIRSVRLQRQVSNEQYAYFTQFLKPLSDNIGFWLIYEIDDIICYNDIPAYNVGRNAFDNDQFYKNVGIMLNLADIITVTTDFLRDYYISQYNVDSDKILVIPNYLPRWWIGEAYNLEKRVLLYEENKKKPRIGFPCSSSHFDLAGVNGYNDDFTHILDFITKTVNKYTWVFIGGYPKQLEHLIKIGKIEFKRPSDLLNYPRELSSYNLQLIVAPLQNNLFNRSKSNIKLLESWALGIPCIAQNLDCYNKYTNMVFNNENDLQNQIDKVLSSRNSFASVVKANRKIVDFGNENSSTGWWLEKNLKLWGQISTLPQKTIHIDMARLMNKIENVVMELK